MTTYFDGTYSARAINARTNAAGTPVTDLTAEEDRLSHSFVTEGWVLEPDSFAPSAGDGMDLLIGSTGARTDYFVVEGDATGQEKYVVRLAARATVSLDSADGTLDRIDEVYLVVEDHAYDGNSRSLARLAYRKGTAAVSPSAPGPDVGWNAYAKLATIDIPAGAPSLGSATITDERSTSQLVVDAGTLDGLVSSDFATSGHNHDADYAPLSHDDATSGHPTATTSDPGLMDSADKSKLDGIESGAQVNPDANTLLNQVKNVDGPGSGLDADTIDGSGSGTLAVSTHNHDSRYYQESEIDVQAAGKRNTPEAAWLERTSNTSSIFGSGSAFTATFNSIVEDDWGGAHLFDDVRDLTASKYYIVEAQLIFEANSTGIRQASIVSSTQGTLATNRKMAVSGDSTVVQVMTVVKATGGAEEITIQGYQTSGSSLALLSGGHFRVLALGH